MTIFNSYVKLPEGKTSKRRVSLSSNNDMRKRWYLRKGTPSGTALSDHCHLWHSGFTSDIVGQDVFIDRSVTILILCSQIDLYIIVYYPIKLLYHYYIILLLYYPIIRFYYPNHQPAIYTNHLWDHFLPTITRNRHGDVAKVAPSISIVGVCLSMDGFPRISFLNGN